MRFYALLVFLACTVILNGCGIFKSDDSLDSFENEISPLTVDYGSGGGATLEVSADRDIKFHGKQSLRLDYDRSYGGYLWAARGYGLEREGAARWNQAPETIDWQRFNAISVAMYGTNNGGTVAFDIKDQHNEMHRTILTDDFNGWKEITVPFRDFISRDDWQPHDAEKNNQVDFPLKSFQFEPFTPEKGSRHFDYVRLVNVPLPAQVTPPVAVPEEAEAASMDGVPEDEGGFDAEDTPAEETAETAA